MRPLLLILTACSMALAPARAQEAAPDQLGLIHASVQHLTDVMVHDIFSPPLASRSYAYPLIAFYEAMRHEDARYASYAGQLNGLDPFPAPPADLHGLTAGLHAFTKVAGRLVFSEDLFRTYMQDVLAHVEAFNVPPGVAARSFAYGQAVADHVLAWAGRDGYAETRTLTRYALSDEPGAWKPTPPEYMEPIEPYWNRLRPFVLDSAAQFTPPPPPPFSVEPGTPFYRDVMEVYEAVRDLTEEQRAIAAFWDCNPFVTHHQGHLSFGLKKISPGGHWMGITGIALRQRSDAPLEAVATYSLVALTLADAFIASWDEKYRSNLIRPETVIRAHIDPTWQPVLQTPPFPEYTSGHSVISTAAATVLTERYGPAFAYTDDVEVRYGLPARTYGSFLEAAAEAAISRLYGGIHYRPAIEHGVVQGRQVGRLVADLVTLRDQSLGAR